MDATYLKAVEALPPVIEAQKIRRGSFTLKNKESLLSLGQFMKHHCHANGCLLTTEPRMLMCSKHWNMVPARVKSLVWEAYRERGGQNGDLYYLPYHLACAEAVEHVARIEEVPEDNSYRRIAMRLRAGKPLVRTL